MSNLAVANRCHAVLSENLAKLLPQYPDARAVVAYLENDAVNIRFAATYDAAEKYMDALPREQQEGAIVMELLDEDSIYLL